MVILPIWRIFSSFSILAYQSETAVLVRRFQLQRYVRRAVCQNYKQDKFYREQRLESTLHSSISNFDSLQILDHGLFAFNFECY